MAAAATSSPIVLSPQSINTKAPSLPPLNTAVPRRRTTSQQRPNSYANRRMSSYSNTSKLATAFESRPGSHVFPIFHSSLAFTLVRDFAYPFTHPLHYGPPPTPSNLSSPVSEHRRLSDPVLSSEWSAAPPWVSESSSASAKEQLPAVSFSDGGPPYSEDEDLHSPIVTTSRHKKRKSTNNLERGRSPGAAPPNRGTISESVALDLMLNGPGEAVVRDIPHQNPPQHRDSNFAKPLQRKKVSAPDELSEDEYSGADDDSDDTRFSKDYQFTIASPDEEMHGKAVALFDFQSEHHNELPLKEGQIILVSYRQAQGWLVAQDPRTGEKGLVPEEFVRLVRDIEGGLNGLQIDVDDMETSEFEQTDSSPDVGPPPTKQDSSKQTTSNPPSSAERHPPVQSTFSTSSKDLDPYPLPVRSEDQAKSSQNER